MERILTNDNYLVLLLLFDEHKVQKTKNSQLSQNEIATKLGFSRPKISKIIKQLVDNDYLLRQGNCNYCLTKKALKTVRQIEKVYYYAIKFEDD